MPLLHFLDARLLGYFGIHKNFNIAVSEKTHSDIKQPKEAGIRVPALNDGLEQAILECLELEGRWLYLFYALEYTHAIQLVIEGILHLSVAGQALITEMLFLYTFRLLLHDGQIVEITDVRSCF